VGFDLKCVRFHQWLKRQGTDFGRVAMLGRQAYLGVEPRALARVMGGAAAGVTTSDARDLLEREGGYAEGFYRRLGATGVDSFDYSDYEGATHRWDMNEPLPEAFRGEYDFVFDGGTLEHVFDYPRALREALTLLRVGGVMLSATPANSYLGHGFYQFGPDLPMAVLRPENGLECLGVYLVEMKPGSKFYRVAPPGASRGRALASTLWPAIMYFLARRVGEVPERLQAFQPDYSQAWDAGSYGSEKGDGQDGRSGAERGVRKLLSGFDPERRVGILRTLKIMRAFVRRNSFDDTRSFYPVSEI